MSRRASPSRGSACGRPCGRALPSSAHSWRSPCSTCRRGCRALLHAGAARASSRRCLAVRLVARRAAASACRDREAARRRIETASGLVAPAAWPRSRTGSRAARATRRPRRCGRRIAQRMEEAARARSASARPAAGLLRRDPYALRVVLALALLLGAIDAGGDWSDRIVRSLSPNIEPGAAAASVALDIWVTPPDYTGLPPHIPAMPSAAQQPVAVPTGSTVLGAGAWRRRAAAACARRQWRRLRPHRRQQFQGQRHHHRAASALP